MNVGQTCVAFRFGLVRDGDIGLADECVCVCVCCDRFCFDANFNNWSFNHWPYATVWLALTIAGAVWVLILLGLIQPEPVRRLWFSFSFSFSFSSL